MEGTNNLALEFTEIQTFPQVKYLTITTGRVQRQFFVNVGQSIAAFLKIFVGFTQSFYWLIRYQPDVILSFGGYVAIPVVILGWLLGKPILTHEQTVVSGRSNKLISYFADKVLVSWPQSLDHFPKAILTGNPIREEILNQSPVTSHQPLIYVTGGSQGARAIDEVVMEIKPALEKKYQVIHQTADNKLSGEESAKILAKADLVISRAGANTVCEILFLGIPAILIPLPNTFQAEQEKNADLVKSVGLGEIILQKNLTSQKLLSLIEKMIKNKNDYLANAPVAKKLVDPGAASKIVAEIHKITAS